MKHITDMEAIFNRSVPLIQGRGGGGKGGGKNDKNTLASRTTARMIEIISEGPIVGLLDGKKSVYLDKTAVVTDTGHENFENVILEEHKGYPDETAFVGHPAVEASTSVETEVTVKNGPVVRTITDPNVNAVRVIIRHPSLVRQSSKGELKRTSVEYAIDYRTVGGNWIEAVRHIEANQKTLSGYQKALRIDLPETGSPWDIRVRRITPDSDDDKLQNAIYFDSYVTLVEGRFTYPHTAAVALQVNAEDLGSNLPSRAYRVRGRIIQVPDNYDPEKRTYSGTWNGTFKQAWTNNPAWIFYDLVTHDRYGLGEFIKPEMVDKWSLYTIGQYCDQLVPSGFRDKNGKDIMEPRFTYNGVINSREEAFYVLQSITKAWRGMAYWAIGRVFATADIPSDPVKLVTPANVIGGEFEYQSTAIKARHSVVLVKWNNPDNFFEPEVEAVIDTKLLHEYNWREKSLTLEGCTSRGLAHRYGKWIIDSEQHETETVSYAASWDHSDIRPGDIIAISDPKKAKIRAGGRIAEVDGERVTLDAPFDATPGMIYTLMVTTPSGKIETRPVAYWESPSVAILKSAFNEEIAPNAMWTITGPDITPRTYRVITIEEEEENIFRITALQHDPHKYDRVERDIVFEPLPYNRKDDTVPSPTNLLCKEVGFISNGQAFHTLTLSWSPPQSVIARGYYIAVDTPEGTRINLGFTSDTSIDLPNATAGEYTWHVQTVGFTGILSRAASLDFWAAGPEGFARPSVSDLTLSDNPGSTEFATRDLSIMWKNLWPTSADPLGEGAEPNSSFSPYYLNNRIRIYRGDDNALLREVFVRDTRYTYSYQANESDNRALGHDGATRSLRVEVVCNDTIGRSSIPAEVTFTNPPPPAIAPITQVMMNEVWLSYTMPSDPDISGVLMWVQKASGFDPLKTEPSYDGLNNPHTFKLEHETVYYIRVAAYDAFGKSELNFASEVSVTTLTDGADLTPPAIPTGLKVTSDLIDGVARMTITWNENTEDDLAGYDVQIAEGAGGYVSYYTTENRWEIDVRSGLAYNVRVRARDRNGNASGTTDAVTHIAIKDDEPPQPVTNVNASAGLNSIWLNWTNPSDGDFSYVEVREGPDSDYAKSKAVEKTSGNSFSRTGLPTETKRFYWLTAYDFSGNASDVVGPISETTGIMPDTTRLTLVGLHLQPNSQTENTVSWAKFTIIAGVPGQSSKTYEISAGSAAYQGDSVYLYYVEGTSVLQATSNIQSMYVRGGHPIAIYNGQEDIQLANGKAMVNGNDIIAGAIGANHLIADQAIIKGKAQIGEAVIETAHINEIDASKIKAESVLSDTILVGDADSDTLKVIKDRASNPAQRVNEGTTLIMPGRISVGGGTSLTSWQSGPDGTEINGGKISANTIAANSLTIGSRGITVDGLTFDANNPSANRVSWTAGTISYVDDNGSAKTISITSGTATWSAGTLWLYWVKNETLIRTTTNFATANATNNVVMASYKGGVFLFASYGRTTIDGGQIKADSISASHLLANSVTANQIAANAVYADAIQASAVRTQHIQAGAVDADKIKAGSITADHIHANRINANQLLQNGTLITDLIAAYAVSDLTAVSGSGNISTVFKSIAGGRRVINYGGSNSNSRTNATVQLYRNGVHLHTANSVSYSRIHEQGDGISTSVYYSSLHVGVFIDTTGSHSDTYEVRSTAQNTYLQISSFKR